VRVPPEYIAKTVAERKRSKSAKGTAGRKRLKLLAQFADDEKKTDSKVKYLKGTMQPPAAAAPATRPRFYALNCIHPRCAFHLWNCHHHLTTTLNPR
jgi:hypothetical protein